MRAWVNSIGIAVCSSLQGSMTRMFALKASSLRGHQGAMLMWKRPAYLPSKAVCFWSQSLIFKDLIIFIFYLYPLPNIHDLEWIASKKPHLNLCTELTGLPQQLWSESFPSSSEFKCWNLNTEATRPGGRIQRLIVRGQSPNQWNLALGMWGNRYWHLWPWKQTPLLTLNLPLPWSGTSLSTGNTRNEFILSVTPYLW